jgi:uncharacterized protein YbjQ (UPF0145 family)
MTSRLSLLAAVTLGISCVVGCSTPSLSSRGAKVVATRNAPEKTCTAIKYIVGHGGGTFGGGMIRNDDLVEYAMNDLRNKAAEVGADYIQHDPPQMGHGDGTTTTVTISGTAYKCGDAAPAAQAMNGS